MEGLGAKGGVFYLAHPMAETPLRRTSLYEEHVALGGRIVAFAGWEMPVQYSGIVDEHQAVRTAAGLFDVSHMGELRLRGEYAAQVVDYLVTNDAKKLVDGQAMYTCACNDRGTILDDLIVYRREQDDWLVVCNASNREKMSAHFARAAKDHCEFEDQSDATALIALQGPRAFEVLAALGPAGAALSSLPSFRFRSRRSRASRPPSPAPATRAKTASRSSAPGTTPRRSGAP